MSAVLTIDYVVASIKNDRNETTNHDVEHWAVLVKEAIEDESIFTGPDVEVVYATIDSATKQISLPPDYIDYVAISVLVNGRLYTLGRNDNLALNASNPDILPICETIEDAENTSYSNNDRYQYLPHYYNGQYVGALYSLGGGLSRSYYRVDKPNRVIQFSNDLPGRQIVIEYISTGIRNGSATVPRESLRLIKSWVHYNKALHDQSGKVPAWRIQLLLNEYNASADQYSGLTNKFTKEEFLDAMWRSHQQGPKR